jgi:6-phosphofructokinase 1
MIMKKRIAMLTGGGDCPGLNAVIRAVAKTAINDYNMKVIGIEDGYEGLIENRYHELKYNDVSGILTRGGTILGTSNKANPFAYKVKTKKGIIEKDLSGKVISNCRKLKVDALVAIGGDGTLTIANKLSKSGLSVIGIPKTIDNDLSETDFTFGFNTAVSIITEAIDRMHSTAQSHHRIMLIEVMGRYAGWLALYSGIAGGGDIILIPEIPYSLEAICKRVHKRSKQGKRFSIVVVAEGAKPKGGKMFVDKIIDTSPDPIRLGGISVKLSADIERCTGLEVRKTILGHLQRGGTPSAFDRILATQFGVKAVKLINNGRSGCMVALKGNDIVAVPINKAVSKLKKVPLNHSLIKLAESIGVSMGV